MNKVMLTLFVIEIKWYSFLILVGIIIVIILVEEEDKKFRLFFFYNCLYSFIVYIF